MLLFLFFFSLFCNMIPASEKQISSPSSTVIKIVAGVHEEKNVEYFNENSKELEKATSHEYKESSSTQTSSSSSLLHKRKVHSYYVTSRFYKPPGSNFLSAFWKRSERNQSAIPQRIISAKFLKVKQLQNELTEAQQKITDLLEENRTLKNIHKRQDSALKKYESQDSCLPQLMRSHEEELRVITSKYKKLKSTHLDLEARYNRQHAELVAVKERHKHLLQISKDKHLFQREHLTKQIEEMKIQINELKNKIKLQSRRLDLEAKNYKHQLSAELSKQKTLQDQIKHLQEANNQLQNTLKDKAKFIVNHNLNHLISNKAYCLEKSKLPLNPLKPLKISSICENVKVKQPNTKHSKEEKENDTSGMGFINCVVGESVQVLNEKTVKNENASNVHRQLIEPTVVSVTERQFEDCFLENNSSGTTQSQKNTETKSDSNNNVKQNSFADLPNLSDSQTKVTYDEEQIRNCHSQNSFDEMYEKDTEDETSSSEKSDDDGELKLSADDTISWLEFHERIKRANDEVDSKLDEFCDTIAPRRDEAASSSTSWRSKFEVQVISKTNRNNNKKKAAINNNEGRLSKDKKSALLTALSQIDEEKNDPNSFHTIFESIKQSSSTRTNNTPKMLSETHHR